MSRYIYFVGGVAVMLLVVLAHRLSAAPAASVAAAAAHSAVVNAPDEPEDRAATAIDDLAAWPGAPRR